MALALLVTTVGELFALMLFIIAPTGPSAERPGTRMSPYPTALTISAGTPFAQRFTTGLGDRPRIAHIRRR